MGRSVDLSVHLLPLLVDEDPAWGEHVVDLSVLIGVELAGGGGLEHLHLFRRRDTHEILDVFRILAVLGAITLDDN